MLLQCASYLLSASFARKKRAHDRSRAQSREFARGLLAVVAGERNARAAASSSALCAWQHFASDSAGTQETLLSHPPREYYSSAFGAAAATTNSSSSVSFHLLSKHN